MDKEKKESLSLPCGFISPHGLADALRSTSVLVAFSGGADSTALLHILHRHSVKNGYRVYAAHLNHAIRGDEADRDEDFCRHFCEELGITFFSEKIDVPRLAKEEKKSVETAARDARYGFFAKLISEHSIGILATAHNANDNLETMIFNLARGCGADGMCGIPSARRFGDAMLVRPILNMSRRDILAYCEEHSLSFVTDSTNTDTDYTRNKIRAKVIPVLEEINPEATKSAARLAASLKADSMCLHSMTDWFLDELGEDMSIEAEKICGSPDAISSRAIMAIYKEASSGGVLEHTHVEAVKQLCRTAAAHSSIDLPGGIVARIENGRLYLCAATEYARSETAEFCQELCDGDNYISEIDCNIFIGSSQSEINIYKNSILLYLDSDKINGTVFVRNRLAGDKILSGKHHKDARKLISAKKIPLDTRARLPVICDDSGILAIPLCSVRDGAASSDTAKDRLVIKIDFN